MDIDLTSETTRTKNCCTLPGNLKKFHPAAPLRGGGRRR
jgi:hypothetical protein